MQQSEPMGATSYGIFKLPSHLAYPRILELRDLPEIKNKLIYVIKSYNEDGIAVIIARDIKEDKVYLSIADFDGNVLDLSDKNLKHKDIIAEFIQKDSPKFISLMKSASIHKLILYVSITNGNPQLVDLRVSLNKFYGPGMIRDLFSKIYPTQEIIKIIGLNDDIFKAIENGDKPYDNDLILKCSKFATVVRDKEVLPLYAKVIR